MIIMERHIVDEDGEYMCCKYNPGIMCENVCCPANCGWRPQIERIRKRQIRSGGLKSDGGIEYLPVRSRAR